MKFHPEEYENALEYWKNRDFPHVSKEQHRVISEKGKGMINFYLRHPALHHLINLAAFAVIFGLDWWVLMRLGAYIVSPVLGGLAVGFLHSYLIYTLIVFTMHEGAAHNLVILGKRPVSKFFRIIANNLGRIASVESDYYAKNHMQHHVHFSSPKDGEFLNFVFPKRLYKSFIPFASMLNINDFKVHADLKYTPSRFLSMAIFLLYHGIFVFFMARHYSWTMIVIALVIVGPNVTFWLDRLRQYTEHNVMPLNVIDGARDLGLGFWGMLIGGGPWGQPCHWTHHLVPGVPWYNQLRLNRFVKKTMNPEQRKVFFLKPLIGFPLLFFDLIKTTGKYEKKFS
ncbi:MAG: fatty acid desaturase [Candidatus Omnitrophota bacterium]